MTDLEAFGKTIRTLRERLKLTQKQLGERCAISPSRISRLEKGKINPKYQTMKRVMRALETDEEQFFEVQKAILASAREVDGALASKKERPYPKGPGRHHSVAATRVAQERFESFFDRYLDDESEAD